ncbi:MAG TPA: hypothetical protein VLV54_17730 [Thermoanaerobaculia bacterium]|nr:hypothetical protein [Thermoanaerobaculia bacterium]
MRPHPQDIHDALNRWLAAERADRFEDADAALREMFEALPLLAPAAGFADRVFDQVLSRAGLQPVKRDVFASLGLRLVLAASLIALSLGAIWLPPVLKALGGLVSLSNVVGLGVRAVAGASRGLALVLRLGEWLFSLGRFLSDLLMAPQAMAALAACILVSALAFRFLRDQIFGERSLTYVDPM